MQGLAAFRQDGQPRCPLLQTEEIDIAIEEVTDGVLIRLAGEIDLRRAPSLRGELSSVLRDAPARLIIDFSDVTHIDSSVVAVLVEALQMSRQGASVMLLCGLPERVRGVFEITRLHQNLFTIVDTVEEALDIANRRRFGRFRGGSVRCSRGQVIDISAVGLRLRSTRKLRGNVKVRVWDEQASVKLVAEVSWRTRHGFRNHECGLRFLEVPASTTNTLMTIVEAAREASSRRRN